MKRKLLVTAMVSGLLVVPAIAATELIPVSRVIEIVEASGKGQVVEVDLDTRRNGVIVYEVDVASRNSVREVEVDARTGAILRQSASHLETMMLRYWDRGSLGALDKARPLSDIVASVERETGGKVIDVDFEHEDGQARYEFEVATNAGVAAFYVDPKSGRRLAFVIDD